MASVWPGLIKKFNIYTLLSYLILQTYVSHEDYVIHVMF